MRFSVGCHTAVYGRDHSGVLVFILNDEVGGGVLRSGVGGAVIEDVVGRLASKNKYRGCGVPVSYVVLNASGKLADGSYAALAE